MCVDKPWDDHTVWQADDFISSGVLCRNGVCWTSPLYDVALDVDGSIVNFSVFFTERGQNPNVLQGDPVQKLLPNGFRRTLSA